MSARNFGILSSTRCLAIAFKQEFSVASKKINVYDLFTSFKNVNLANKSNPFIQKSIERCIFLGHIEPFVILIGGDEATLRAIKSCWMRTQLNPPHGFRIESIGDASGLVLNSVPQYSSMRLEEIIFQVICQVSTTEPTCSERRLLSCLASIFSDMRASPPPRQAVEVALMALIRTGTIYFCGQGYNLLTPDKLHVANWLRTLPPNTTTQGYESPMSSVKQLKSPVRKDSVRCEPAQSLLTSVNTSITPAAPLAKTDPDQRDAGPLNFTDELPDSCGLPRPLEKPRSTLRKTDSSPALSDLGANPMTTTENQASTAFLDNSWVGGIPNKSLTTPSPLNILSAPTKRRVLGTEALSPNGFLPMTSGECTSACNWRLSGGPFNVFTEHRESQGPLQREQLSRSYYHSPERHYYGRGLAEQRTNLSKSADFHILNKVKDPKAPMEEPKKRGSTALLQWFFRRIRHLRQSIKRRPQEPDWHTSATATFPIFYQNSNFIPQSAATGMVQLQQKQSGHGKTTTMQDLGRLERFCFAKSPRNYLIGELESGTNRSASYCSQTCGNLRRCLSLAEQQKNHL
uniref:Winged helix Storkhead-box1 domain-containing protein n=1 Tax=Schistocephalus solidus TaxID=70667 RepID=A0A0X3NXS0_SCHSO